MRVGWPRLPRAPKRLGFSSWLSERAWRTRKDRSIGFLHGMAVSMYETVMEDGLDGLVNRMLIERA
jgi:hypothetical protein